MSSFFAHLKKSAFLLPPICSPEHLSVIVASKIFPKRNKKNAFYNYWIQRTQTLQSGIVF